MKVTIFMIFLTFGSVAFARTYYVAPTGGSDMYAGTLSQPWATWQKAFNTAQAGDTVYFRGGVWTPTSKSYTGYAIAQIDPGAGRGNNGTHDNPICFFAYTPDYEAGNFPILDGSIASQATTGNIGLSINEATYLKFKGLTIRNVRMLNATNNVSGIEMTNHNANKHAVISFENMTVHHIGGAGYWLAGYDTLYLKNSDVHDVCDSLDITSPGGDGDGFNITSGGTAIDTFKIAYIEGCRAWNCSDDGFDLSSTKQFEVSNTWSFNNGHQYVTGDGTGFKFSYSDVLTTNKRKISNCLAAYNVHAAFAEVNLVDPLNGPRLSYFNNLVYKCEYGFFNAPDAFNCNSGKAGNVYRNNLIYKLTSTYYNLFGVCGYSYYTKFVALDHNNWLVKEAWPYYELNPAYTVTDDDFVSFDSAQLSLPRKIDGSLPGITFMKLKEGSDLIDAGIDVGLPYYGTAPDLGYSEYLTGSYNPANQPPVVTISSPTKSTSFISPATITIEANASDPDGTVSKVEFYLGTVKLGERTTMPYSYTWKEVTEGTYFLTAVATDNKNLKTTSATVSVVVEKSATTVNQLPFVSIISPDNGKKYKKNDKVVIKVEASDPDGTISKVELKNANITLVELTTTPYTYIWEVVDTGKYVLTAFAIDNLGAITVSSALELEVEENYEANSGVIRLYPNPNNGHFSIDLYSSLNAESKRVSVINLDGKTIFNDITTENESTRAFDLSDKAPGTYILMVSIGNKIIATKKFIMR